MDGLTEQLVDAAFCHKAPMSVSRGEMSGRQRPPIGASNLQNEQRSG
jgi:hypothetical protein